MKYRIRRPPSVFDLTWKADATVVEGGDWTHYLKRTQSHGSSVRYGTGKAVMMTQQNILVVLDVFGV